MAECGKLGKDLFSDNLEFRIGNTNDITVEAHSFGISPSLLGDWQFGSINPCLSTVRWASSGSWITDSLW